MKIEIGLNPLLKEPFFKNMLVMCAQETFMYKDEWYEQVDGIAMGSPLAPSLANMSLECRLLLNKQQYYPW